MDGRRPWRSSQWRDHERKGIISASVLESIHYVISWLCHRQCPHCYEERFRPYHGAELTTVVSEARSHFQRIIEHLPDHMRYCVPEAMGPDGSDGNFPLLSPGKCECDC